MSADESIGYEPRHAKIGLRTYADSVAPDLELHWPHMSEDSFSHDAVHITEKQIRYTQTDPKLCYLHMSENQVAHVPQLVTTVILCSMFIPFK